MRAIPVLLAMGGVVAGFASGAWAEESPWTVKAGISQVKPKSDSGITGIDVSTEAGLTPAFEYRLTPNLSAEVLLAIPFKHDVELNGAKVGSFKHLPPTVSAKYYFTPGATFSPYVGLGLNYTLVFGEKTTGALAGGTLSADDSIGLAATLGCEYRMANSPWGVALDVRYIRIKSDVEVNGASQGTLDVSPLVTGLSAVYHY